MAQETDTDNLTEQFAEEFDSEPPTPIVVDETIPASAPSDEPIPDDLVSGEHVTEVHGKR